VQKEKKKKKDADCHPEFKKKNCCLLFVANKKRNSLAKTYKDWKGK
jgi:hypothetical protein